MRRLTILLNRANKKGRDSHRGFCGPVRQPSERSRADRVPGPWFGTGSSISSFAVGVKLNVHWSLF